MQEEKPLAVSTTNLLGTQLGKLSTRFSPSDLCGLTFGKHPAVTTCLA